MEKNIKKNKYICIAEICGCTAGINTTLLIKYNLIKKEKKTQPSRLSPGVETGALKTGYLPKAPKASHKEQGTNSSQPGC